jgi:hypothetical protein
MKYFYLVASLPPVTLGDTPPWTPDEFLFHGQGALSPADWCELSLLIENRLEEASSDFVAWWHALDTQIRNQQARYRAGRLHVEARSFLRMHSGYDLTVAHGVKDAMSRTHPLEREMALDRCRWAALDDRILGDRFGFEEVLAYAIRLRLMERWDRMSDKEGLKRVETFITDMVDESIEFQRLGDT